MLRNEWLAHLDGLVVFRGLLAAEPLHALRAAQAADEGAVLAVGDRRHGAGIDEIGVAVVGIRAADVAKGQKLLLHGLRFILIDLAAKRITLKFHRVSPKNL